MKLDGPGGDDTTFVIRFHGVRGSHPVTRPAAGRFGGNTSCVEVLHGDLRLIFDLGTGLIPLGDELAAAGPSDSLILVSHYHHDHTVGFPFFKPLYDARSNLFLGGPGEGGREFSHVLGGLFENPYFPVQPAHMASKPEYVTLEHGDRLSWSSSDRPPDRLDPDAPRPDGLSVRVFRNVEHPNGGVLNFRVDAGERSFVLATDVEGTAGHEGDLVDFARGADVLIHDAQYTDEEYATKTKGWGHSTWRMAAEVAERSRVGCLVLYHHDPAHDDDEIEEIERSARSVFPRCVAAAEGLEIRV